jgi:RNA polymerase sigma factor for flagellar operon FliA
MNPMVRRHLPAGVTLEPEAEQRVDSCQGLVRSLAWKIQQKVGRMVELDDLIGYGQIGLVEASRNFDASRGHAFSTFAHYRIRGAILDGLSKLSWFRPTAYHSSWYEQLADELLEDENADRTEPSGAWIRRTSGSLAVSFLLSSDAADNVQSVTGHDAAPDAGLLSEEVRRLLREAIAQLPPQQSDLITLMYFQGHNLTEAARKLGIGKPWASRLHARTLTQLAEALRRVGVGSGA